MPSTDEGLTVRSTAAVGLVLAMILSGCSALERPLEPAPSPPQSSTVAATANPSSSPASLSPSVDLALAIEPVPDPNLVATMTCEPISDATVASHEARWGAVDWSDAVQVPVGVGLTPGELWWVTVSTSDEVTGRVRLTNAGSLDDPSEAEWLIAAGWESRSTPQSYWKYFPHVEWDASGHSRLHAAVAKGYECLELEYPEIETQ